MIMNACGPATTSTTRRDVGVKGARDVLSVWCLRLLSAHDRTDVMRRYGRECRRCPPRPADTRKYGWWYVCCMLYAYALCACGSLPGSCAKCAASSAICVLCCCAAAAGSTVLSARSCDCMRPCVCVMWVIARSGVVRVCAICIACTADRVTPHLLPISN